jgi:hypothetical protein
MKSMLCLLLSLMVLTLPARAGQDYVEVLVGGGEGGLLPPQGDYRDWKIVLALGQNINELALDKLNTRLPGEWSFRLMPFVSYVSSPSDNLELGCMASVKIAIPLARGLTPYLAAGTGPMYTTQNTREQATRFNFVSYGAVGVQYLIDEQHALGFETWRRHFSNASIKDPNDGVDTSEWYLSFTIFTD